MESDAGVAMNRYKLRMVSRLLFKAVSRAVLQPIHRQLRGMTLGTRTAVIDAEGRVLLVRHSYAPGWMMPGGGVERGETLAESALRELREEAGIVAEEPLALHGIFLNDRQFRGDHVACFVLRRFRQEARLASFEIAETGFFARDSLPPDTTSGTRRRLAEIFEKRPPDGRW